MPEISLFKIHKAEAHVNAEGDVLVRLFYPRNPEMLEKRLGENLEFGLEVFSNLKAKRNAQIANINNPISSPAAGICYVLKDDHLVCSRRDAKAPNHKFYHGIYSGFLQSKEDAYSEEGINQAGLREGAEECLFITREVNPRLIVPEDAKDITLEAAKNLGLKIPSLVVPFETLPGRDTLEVYGGGNLLFTMRANIDFTYESLTVLNVSHIRRIPFSSTEVIPLDAEGLARESGFLHFNRESYVINLSKLENKFFGDVLEDPSVYQVRIEEGIPKPFSPSYTRPYLGPNNRISESPHIWAPNNLLLKSLAVLGVKGYKGKWVELEYEREYEKWRRENKSTKSYAAA
ncbi:MAG: hypothetical protein Q8Q31_03200 [Nanoarchaeota archaeon]|nr:hypothetical protein [Nanoarchaeota archaeon]